VKYGNVISKTTTTDATNVGIQQPEYSGSIAGTADGNYGFSGSVDMTAVQPYLTGTSVYASGADFTNPRLGITAAPSITVVGTQSIFGSLTNLTVPNGTTANFSGNVNISGSAVVQSGGTLNFGNNSITGAGTVNIQSGAIVSLTAADGFTNSINGVVRNSGTKTISNLANYTFNGTSAQTTGGLWSGGNNVTINNAAGVTLSSAAVVSGALNLTAGTFTAGNNLLTIGSSPTSQGVINNVAPTFAGTLSATSIKFRRYFGSAALRGVSAPLNGASNTINSVYVPQGSSCNGVKEFDEFTNSWIPVDFLGTACTDNLPVGQGNLVYGFGAKTFEFTGLPLTGTQTYSITRSAGTVPPAPFVARGWNALGNPYPSNIQWSSMAAIAGNTTQSPLNAYIWNSGANNYGTITSAGVTANGANNVISPGQAILIRRSSVGSGNITFDNTVRVTSSAQTAIRKATGVDKDIRFTLTGTESADEIVLYSGSDAVNVEKAFAPVETSVSMFIPSEEALTFKVISENETVVPVSVKLPENGTYTIASSALKGLAEGKHVILEDKAANKFIPVSEGFTYSFKGTEGNSARFAIHFQDGQAVANSDASSSALIYTSNQDLTIRLNNADAQSNGVVATISDLSGRKLNTWTIEGNTFQKSLNLAPGIYTVVVKGNGFAKTQKVVVSNK
jgi:hypothetical protein